MQEHESFPFCLTSTLSWLIHFSPCSTSLSQKNSFLSKLAEVVLAQPLCRNVRWMYRMKSGARIIHTLASNLRSNLERSTLLHRGDAFHTANLIRLSPTRSWKMEKLANQQWVEIGQGMQRHWWDWPPITGPYCFSGWSFTSNSSPHLSLK